MVVLLHRGKEEIVEKDFEVFHVEFIIAFIITFAPPLNWQRPLSIGVGVCLAHEVHYALVSFPLVSKHPHSEILVQVRPQHEDGRNIFDSEEFAYWFLIVFKAVDFGCFKIFSSFVASC